MTERTTRDERWGFVDPLRLPRRGGGTVATAAPAHRNAEWHDGKKQGTVAVEVAVPQLGLVQSTGAGRRREGSKR